MQSGIQMLENILITTDGSKPSEQAAEYGIELAKRIKGKVLALYVADTSKFTSGLSPTDPFLDLSPQVINDAFISLRSFALQEGEIATQMIQELARNSGVPCEKLNIEGYPANEILRVAEDNKVDIIVMGSIGKTGLGDFLLGGVAGKVVMKSKVPVLVVPIKDFD